MNPQELIDELNAHQERADNLKIEIDDIISVALKNDLIRGSQTNDNRRGNIKPFTPKSFLSSVNRNRGFFR